MVTIILAVGIGIFLVVDLSCGVLLSIINKKQGAHKFVFPGYSIHAYYKYKKEHIK